MTYLIQSVDSDMAEIACRIITQDLPEYFGLPECNAHYAQGVRSRINFAALVDNHPVALLCLEFPYSNNANIYWMAVLRAHQGQGVGHALIQTAIHEAISKRTNTITVETLAPEGGDANYLKTYRFYEKVGFKPLLNLKPAGYTWNMVYMALNLTRIPFIHTDKPSLSIRPFKCEDIPMLVKTFTEHHWPKPSSTFKQYWQEQNQQQRKVWLAFSQNSFAGYITLKWESAYPPFQQQEIPEIMDLNVLPPYRNRGIATELLNLAETEAAKRGRAVGIGVGLYKDYGAAQRLYLQRGYIPDGLGVTYQYQPVPPGKTVCLDDDLILWFTKQV